MNRKNKNEKEKNTKPMGAAQELDMDALENVAGGRVQQRGRLGSVYYQVVDDETGKVIKSFNFRRVAECYDKRHNRHYKELWI